MEDTLPIPQNPRTLVIQSNSIKRVPGYLYFVTFNQLGNLEVWRSALRRGGRSKARGPYLKKKKKKLPRVLTNKFKSTR